jgi:hypothetical protein
LEIAGKTEKREVGQFENDLSQSRQDAKTDQ